MFLWSLFLDEGQTKDASKCSTFTQQLGETAGFQTKWNLTTNSTILGEKKANGALVLPFIILPIRSVVRTNQVISPWAQRTPDLVWKGKQGTL